MFNKAILAIGMMIVAVNMAAMPSYEDVLVVVNDKSPASLEVGEYFKNARKIPDVNVVHVSMIDKQDTWHNEFGQATADEKKLLVDAIKNHLITNKLTGKINYIVLTRGIPMYASAPEFPSAPFHVTDIYVLFSLSESAADNSIPDIFCRNKYFYYYNTDILNKKFSSNKFGYYIVSRLDGPGVNNIEDMIDNTGFPAYESYRKNGGKAKFLTLHQAVSPRVKNEIKKRNIELVQVPADATTKQLTATMDTVANDLMFAFFNNVVNSDYGYEPLPKDNNFYADADMVTQYPFIYRGATFIPGSFATCFRSHPSRLMNRDNGGLLQIDADTAKITDYQKAYDGSDVKFRHQTCVAYDPVNNQIWCGTGEPALNVDIPFDNNRGTDEFYREHMRNEGGGIAIYDAANGNILTWINANDAGSPLKNNRVVKMAYDKTSKLMWVMHYKGVQYYDLVNKSWHDVPALQNDFAAGCSIYPDPYDSDKVYFSFYYSDDGGYNKVSSQISGAANSIYEYSKSAKTVKTYVIDTDSAVTGVAPQMVKTSADTLWVAKGRYVKGSKQIALIRYDLTQKAIVEKILPGDLIPEIKSPPSDLRSILIQPPHALTAGPNNTVLTVIGCEISYKAARKGDDGKTYTWETKNYLIRITGKTGAASETEVISAPLFNTTHATVVPNFYARSLITDPQDNNKVYMALSWPYTYATMTAKSTDGGKTWTKLSDSSKIFNVYDLAINGKTIYAVRGYQTAQNLISDFVAFGLNAFGGGIVHDTFMYNPSRMTPRDSSIPAYVKGVNDIYCTFPKSLNWDFACLDTNGIFYELWDKLKTYKTGDLVTDGAWVYASAKDNNTGNPLTPYWQAVDISNVQDYSATATYAKYDLVKYNEKVYFCLLSNSTYAPDSAYGKVFWWETDISNVSEYSSSIQYAANSIVLYNDIYYIATQTTQGAVPGVEYWQKTSTAVTSERFPISQAEPMMFMYTDGFSIAEARFATQYQYPQEGGGGWTGHFLMFEPKCAPFAPRVDEENLSSIYKDGKIEIPLFSPGLQSQADGFIAETINSSTVAVTDELGQPFAVDNIAYDASGRKIVITGNFIAPTKYSVTLKCGVDGIKNVKGASLTNTRADEFKDEITYVFENNNFGPSDLSVAELTWTPASPEANKTLTLTFKIANTGNSMASAGASANQLADVYLDGVKLGSVSYDDVAVGGSVTLTYDIPAAKVTAGAHTIKVIADADNKVVEADDSEADNSLESSFTAALPDIRVKEISILPASPNAGQPVTVSFKIENISTVPASAGASANQLADVYLDGSKLGSVSYDDVAAADSVILTYDIPAAQITAGNHTVKVIADADNKIVEADESEASNSMEANFTAAVKPDLTVSGITLSPAEPLKGQSLTVNFNVNNIGDAVAPANICSVYFDSVKVGEVNCSTLAAGASATLSFVLDGSKLTLGTHAIKIEADINNSVSESNETNNSLEKSVTVNQAAELEIKDVWTFPQTPVAGKSLQVFCKLNNIGYGSAKNQQTVELYIDDVKVASIACNSLAAKSGVTLSFVVDGQYITVGNRTFKVVADSENVISEINKTNNSLAKSISVTGTNGGGLSVKADFNGRGASDILWQNQQDGTVGIWTGNGSNSWKLFGSADSNWEIVGTGDFNGNGKSDVLWQNKTTGYVGMWENGTTWQGFGVASRAEWEIVGVGDFNGNGKSDILWQNTNNGYIGMWEAGTAWQTLGGAAPRADWEVVGVGDFNGNGKSDILWQNKITGYVGIWESGITWQGFGVASRAEWEIAGVGDFNGNGKSDILWQNKNNGYTGMWESGTAWQGFGAVPRAEWEIVGVGDFNGNGKSDILWQNKNNGYTGMWESGAAWQAFGAADRSAWKIRNQKNSN